MSQPLSGPRMFGDVLGQLSMETTSNQAVCDIAYDFKAQNAINAVLLDWGQSRFIPLIGVNTKSQISIPLYAGDGLVAKITPERMEDATPKPHVLPAIRRKTVEADYVGYYVQMYPLVATGGMTQSHVDYMKKLLGEAGYEFTNGDDRPDNLGRLPGGDLVVLDHGAVRAKPGRRPDPAATDEWLAKVHKIYGPLYGPDGVKPQSAETKFDRSPAKPHLVMHYNQAAAKAKAVKQAPAWQRMLGLGR
ncbi:MAG: hypothetical protein AAF556_07675 [Pseudomonadota bacterium]